MPPKKASAPKKPAVKKTAAAKAKKVTPKKASPAPKKASPAPKKASAPKKKASPAPKKPVAAVAAAAAAAPAKAAAASPAKKAAAASTIMVEACKQCQCFKKRFEILEKAMKAIKPGLTFKLNAEKPTKGVFIVRTDKGEVIWSMTGLTRPFQPLKAVDFEEVAKELVARL